jgi:hypothetical protein
VSGSASDDSTYTNVENQLASLISERDSLAAQMLSLLEAAEFGGHPISEQQAESLVSQAAALIAEANALAP